MNFEDDVRREFARRGVEVVALYRLGPYSARVLFLHGGTYSTAQARVENDRVFLQSEVERRLVVELTRVLIEWLVRQRNAGVRVGDDDPAG